MSLTSSSVANSMVGVAQETNQIASEIFAELGFKAPTAMGRNSLPLRVADVALGRSSITTFQRETAQAADSPAAGNRAEDLTTLNEVAQKLNRADQLYDRMYSNRTFSDEGLKEVHNLINEADALLSGIQVNDVD